ncbi:hypothetical protein GCM10010156_64990 [Planobispora rosea]|uniref:Uncharacterized protein n=1 Tax=Planobispora rosea TaxID=35762 RepID=A0A8J3S878_PLARO|nr:hypothetical protein [Planobispora rosea]GGS97787.1 hypothetical protein GCM10010156_64990 [Planobispora rosea]GIH87822.1 hypothetical protein Pro02_62300 [Planobispora rosea]
MEYHVILTLAKPMGSGVQQATLIRTVTAESGATRADLLDWMLKQAPQMHGSCILFFSVEPNALPAALKAVKS